MNFPGQGYRELSLRPRLQALMEGGGGGEGEGEGGTGHYTRHEVHVDVYKHMYNVGMLGTISVNPFIL